MKEKNKYCIHCGQKIEENEKYCTKCGKKIEEEFEINNNKPENAINRINNKNTNKKMPVWAIVLVVLSFLFFISIILPGDETLETKENEARDEIIEKNNETTKSSKTEEKEEKEETSNDNWYNYDIEDDDEINYKKVSIDTLEKALEANAAAAKEKYNNKYLEITGRLGVIDSDLKYIEILSIKNEWDFIGVFCTIKSAEQKEAIKKLKKDQKVVVKGKITDVGEIMGYYLDLDEITGK